MMAAALFSLKLCVEAVRDSGDIRACLADMNRSVVNAPRVVLRMSDYCSHDRTQRIHEPVVLH
jgi:hypothetical protein